MSRKLGVGIIGTGMIARDHVKGYQALADDCRIVAVADIVAEKAEAAAREAGAETWYTDYHQLLARPDIDLVSICTPPFVHAPAAVAALQAGKHVLCEKPMAASLEECDQMLAAADASGKLLSVVFQKRFLPQFWRFKQVVDSGLLGSKVTFGKCDVLWWRGDAYYDMWWRGTWEMECGGATINHAVHDIDALLWFMGEDVVSIYADMDARAHDIEVEDLSAAIVRFANGALAQVTATTACHQNKTQIEVSGDRAAVCIPWGISAKLTSESGFPNADNQALLDQIATLAEATPVTSHLGHAAQIEDLIRAIRTDGRPVIDGREGRKSLEFITAVYKSASTGSRVTLPIAPNDPYYTTNGLRSVVKRHPSSKLRKAVRKI